MSASASALVSQWDARVARAGPSSCPSRCIGAMTAPGPIRSRPRADPSSSPGSADGFVHVPTDESHLEVGRELDVTLCGDLDGRLRTHDTGVAATTPPSTGVCRAKPASLAIATVASPDHDRATCLPPRRLQRTREGRYKRPLLGRPPSSARSALRTYPRSRTARASSPCGGQRPETTISAPALGPRFLDAKRARFDHPCGRHPMRSRP
jgi:hypothetical protein